MFEILQFAFDDETKCKKNIPEQCSIVITVDEKI